MNSASVPGPDSSMATRTPRASRRAFLGIVAGSAATPMLRRPAGPMGFGAAPRHESTVRELVRLHDARIADALASQDRNPDSPTFGGVANRWGIVTPHGTAGLVRTLATAFASPGGAFQGHAMLLEPMRDAARRLLELQHDDGTIDLYSTNFHSTPDLGFVAEPVYLATVLLRGTGDARCGETLGLLARFAERGGRAMTVGGIHTPNHRWVVCAALAMFHSLWPNDAYTARIDEWLAEGIDIDPDGQFDERSASVYSPLTCKVLMTTARLLDRPALYEPVRRNLAMTLHYVHPDGEVATEASRRQDKGSGGPMTRYHYPYRAMAVVDGDGRFAAMARRIESLGLDKLVGDLAFYLTDPHMQRDLPASAELPTDFEKHFAHSGLVRIRRGVVSATILERSPTILTFRKGGCALDAFRVASAFFGKGQFVGNALKRDGEWWVLEQRLEGPYYQPLPKDLLPGDGDWQKMDRGRRPRSEVQEQTARVRVRELPGNADGGPGLEIEVDIRGTDNVPVAVEFAFRRDGDDPGTLRGVRPTEDVADAWLVGAGGPGAGPAESTFSARGQTVSVRMTSDEAPAPHTWTQLRGALPKADGHSVYVTGFTPFVRRFVIS